jgi:hypothetical protein
MNEMKAMVAQMREQGATVYDRELAVALRAIEQGARGAKTEEGDAAYLELMARLLQATPAPDPGRPDPPSSLIVP